MSDLNELPLRWVHDGGGPIELWWLWAAPYRALISRSGGMFHWHISCNGRQTHGSSTSTLLEAQLDSMRRLYVMIDHERNLLGTHMLELQQLAFIGTRDDSLPQEEE